MAISGGRSPWLMLRELAHVNLPWSSVHLFQVDERVTHADAALRNWSHITASLLAHAPLRSHQLFPMPVTEMDLPAAARQYGRALQRTAGAPAVFDLVHLGLGDDGRTASLLPGDAALDVTGADVALTAPYKGHRRMTLTYPLINRARRVLWLATGAEKRAMVARLLAGDTSIPAGRVAQHNALLLVDQGAAATAA